MGSCWWCYKAQLVFYLLGLVPNPQGITSTSTLYVVVGRLSQLITCVSTLNVSGSTTLANPKLNEEN